MHVPISIDTFTFLWILLFVRIIHFLFTLFFLLLLFSSGNIRVNFTIICMVGFVLLFLRDREVGMLRQRDVEKKKKRKKKEVRET